uniref:Uncharacterized protein n=1 Tax=Anopheles marajoara TaxID=58244 RepID=A0A2M4C3Y2_9DIPT
MLLNPVHLILNRATVQLDLDDVCLLLALLHHTDLRVSDDTDELAVADHLLERILDRLLAQIVGPLLRGLGESLLLGRVPVLVETTTALLGQMLGPDVAQSTRSERSFDVADGTDDHDRRCLQDSDGLQHLLLVDL